MKKNIPYIVIFGITVMLLISPEQSLEYARNSLNLCFEIIIPSLFPFFICSGLLIYSGFAKSLSQICRPVMKPLFNINGCGAAAFVLGIISGYPLGAVTACNLYENGYLSKSETERLLAFCNNSGPLFILGAIGSAVYAAPKIGIILYVSHILSALTVGIMFRFYSAGAHTSPDYALNQSERNFSETFAEVLSNSVKNILTICGAIVFFGAVSGIISRYLPLGNFLNACVCALLEMTNGIEKISRLDIPLATRLILSSFAVGFAGLCVHLQVMSCVVRQHLSLRPYIIGKFLHGIFAALYTFVLFRIFPQTVSVFAPSSSGGYFASSLCTVIGALFCAILAALVIVFSFMAGKRRCMISRKSVRKNLKCKN